jgi:hypothetical protein
LALAKDDPALLVRRSSPLPLLSLTARSQIAQEADDLGREAVGLVDVDPVTGRLDADPADAVLIEERAAALAGAAGDSGGEQHRGRSAASRTTRVSGSLIAMNSRAWW